MLRCGCAANTSAQQKPPIIEHDRVTFSCDIHGRGFTAGF